MRTRLQVFFITVSLLRTLCLWVMFLGGRWYYKEGYVVVKRVAERDVCCRMHDKSAQVLLMKVM